MLGKLKYCVSHCPLVTWQQLSDAIPRPTDASGNINMNQRWSNILLFYLGHLSNVVLVAGLALGLYTRWAHSQDMAVLLIACLGLLIFAITGALVYYFSMGTLGTSVSRLWLGCLLGVVSFPEAEVYPSEMLQKVNDAMNILLAVSLLIQFVSVLSRRLLHLTNNNKPELFNSMDGLEMVGLAISSLVVGKDFLAISLLVAALAMTITAIRTRSYVGLLNLIVLIVITTTVFFPKMLHVLANPYALSLFTGRMALDAIADLVFSSLTTLQRWEPIFQRSKLAQRLLILVIVVLELSFFILCAKQMPNHKEWFVVVPMFAAFGLVWFCYHLVFLVTCWQLSGKIADCTATYKGLEDGSQNMSRIMASKGVRHFSLISQRLVLVTLLTTIVLGGIGWQTKTPVSVGLWMLIIPVEIAVLSVLLEMGSTLGGTCVGYAVVAPAFAKSSNTATVLPAGSIETLSSRATNILNNIQKFFTYHLVDTFGCDFSSSGLTSDAISSKLGKFFLQVSSGGPRYDTYLLYYSGPVYDNGDWALAGNERLTLATLLDWWHEIDGYSGARLILVLDTDHSARWLRAVSRLTGDTVGLQTSYRVTASDPEDRSTSHLGDFTADWVDCNTINLSGVDLHSRELAVRAAYAVSRSWTDFTFHRPTDQDINQHWNANFPRFTRPLIKVTNFPQVGSLCCCFTCLLRCLRRKRMMWLPPLECDTGHGFKLIRS